MIGTAFWLTALVGTQALGAAPVRDPEAATAQGGPSATQPAKAKPAKAKKAKTEAVKGTIQQVDPTARKISLKDQKGALRELKVGVNCVIIKKGRRRTLDSLKRGDRVIATYEGDTVKVIRVR